MQIVNINNSRRSRRIIQCSQLAAAFTVLCVTLQAYSSGPPPRYSGAPGDDPGSCSSCHRGLSVNGGPGSVTIVLPGGNSYTPGVKQHIVVQVSDPQQRRWGFQLAARLKSDPMNGQAGDLQPTDGFTQVICDSGAPKPCVSSTVVQFIEHTLAGTRPGATNGVTFEFDWTPPATNSGNVVLYAAGNAANGDGNLTGDRVYNTSVELSVSAPPAPAASSTYTVQNLVSDVPGLAAQTDPNLINPWGVALNANGPFWISNNRAGTTTLYNGAGQPFPAATPTVVTIPGGSPTAQVFNNTTAFALATGNPALFLFASESGIISGWNPGVDPSNAKVVADNSSSGAVYKGLALGVNSSGPLMYAANFHTGTVDVFDARFQPATVSGGFRDSNLPAGFAPFNIRRFGGSLYVTYALQDDAKHDDVRGAGNGYIDIFDMDGNLLRRLVSSGVLNSPWGVALAPDFFGDYSNTLLVGNFGDGTVNAFDPATGSYLGTLQDQDGNSIAMPGLWGLQFGNGHDGGDANALYFTAGIANGGNVEDHGLLGSIALKQ